MAQAIVDDLNLSLNSQLYTLKSPLLARYDSPLTGKVNVGDSSLDNQVNLNTWSIDDQRGGLGISEMDESIHSDRYWWGNCYTDQKGHLFLPRLATAITSLPTTTALSITNADMELNANWTTGGGVSAQSGVQYHGGVKSWQLNASSWTYQDIESGTDFKGRWFTVKCWVYASAGTQARIGLEDDVSGYTYSSYHTGVAGWELLTVSKKMSLTAARVRVVFKSEAINNGNYFDDATLFCPDVGTPSKQIIYNTGNHFLASGNVLSMLNNSTGATFDYISNFSVNILDIIVSENNALYIFLGDDDYYWYMEPTVLDECDVPWSEEIDTDVTATKDTSAFKTGAASMKLEVAAGCAANDILISQAITSTDLSGHDMIGMWVKSSVTLDAGDIDFMIDDTAKCASPTEHPDFPAIVADTWTYINLPLTYSPSAAVISFGVRMLVDKGAFNLWIDRVEAWNFVQTDVAKATWGIHWDGKLFKFASDGSGAYATDPSDPTAVANWTALTASLADVSGEIESFFIGKDAAGNDVIYCATNARLKVLDFTNDLWLDSALKLPNHPNGGKGAVYWQDGHYISYGLGIKRYVTGSTATISESGLNRDDGIPSEYNGEITFLLGDAAADNMFALVDASQTTGNSKSGLWAYNGRGWKCWWVSASNNEAMNTAIISSSYGYRIYWNVGATINYIDLPRGIQNVEQLIGTQTFAAAGVHISPWFNAGTQAFDKLIQKLISYAKMVTTSSTIAIGYRINKTNTDLATGFTTIETLDTTAENGQNEELFASGAGLEFETIQIRLDLARGSTTTQTPDLQGLVLAYELMTGADGFWTFTFTIVCDGAHGIYPKEQSSNIETALALGTLVPLIKDSTGTTHYCRLQLLNAVLQTGVNYNNEYTIQATVI